MSLSDLPTLPTAHLRGIDWPTRPSSVERWRPNIRAESNGNDATSISVMDVIGESWDGSGVTAKGVKAVLRNIGPKPVVVNINSPGGDFFEGVAIYNTLMQHPAKVDVNVLGIAASAASVVAMAGDSIRMGDGSFMMIHNAWALAMGNRTELREIADWLEPFDNAMRDLYAKRTGMAPANVAKLMDAETYLSASDAVDKGFADALMEAPPAQGDAAAAAALHGTRLVEAMLRAAGKTAAEAKDVISQIKRGAREADPAPTARDAGGSTARDAGEAVNVDTLVAAMTF